MRDFEKVSSQQGALQMAMMGAGSNEFCSEVHLTQEAAWGEVG